MTVCLSKLAEKADRNADLKDLDVKFEWKVLGAHRKLPI